MIGRSRFLGWLGDRVFCEVVGRSRFRMSGWAIVFLSGWLGDRVFGG